MKREIVLTLLYVWGIAVSIIEIHLLSSSNVFHSDFEDADVIRDKQFTYIETGSKRIKLINVPDVYQATDYTCGPSSLTSVLSYYGKKDLREMQLAQLALTDSQVGTMPEALYRAIIKLGFQAKIVENMTINLLQQCLSQQRPVIVLIQAWKDDDDTTPYPSNFDNGHYVVAIGFDDKYIYFQDPWIHGSLTYMWKIDLFDRWHGNTNEPYDRHIYGSGIIVLQPLKDSQTVIYME